MTKLRRRSAARRPESAETTTQAEGTPAADHDGTAAPAEAAEGAGTGRRGRRAMARAANRRRHGSSTAADPGADARAANPRRLSGDGTSAGADAGAANRRRHGSNAHSAVADSGAADSAVTEAGDPRAFASAARRRREPPVAVAGHSEIDEMASSLGERAGHAPETPGEPAARSLAEVVTQAGAYLQSAALDDAPARMGTPDGHADDAALRVWAIAFGLAVRRRFEPETPLAEITRTVGGALREHAAAALPLLDAEMMVRAELGEQVPGDEIDPAVRVAAHLLLFASLTDEMALGRAELDALIAEAESAALNGA